ncbi:hypothetical protein [Campylobacter sp. 7477a]|uniref:hypothetical protein n=1 Tax=Campylobacter sp. 7477a TaxID=2735741 RepID=UPI0030146213|nr:hypothetical protein [Campylobacter sp. 7477a]
MIAQTSREAYKAINPELGEKQRKILEMFAKYPNGATRQEISRANNEPINSVTGRSNELLKKGRLMVIGTKIDKISRHRNEVLKVVERIA